MTDHHDGPSDQEITRMAHEAEERIAVREELLEMCRQQVDEYIDATEDEGEGWEPFDDSKQWGDDLFDDFVTYSWFSRALDTVVVQGSRVKHGASTHEAIPEPMHFHCYLASCQRIMLEADVIWAHDGTYPFCSENHLDIYEGRSVRR